MDAKTKLELIEVLMLMVDNEHTSASREGLEARAKNRQLAIDKLSKLLGLSPEEVEQSYWRREGRI